MKARSNVRIDDYHHPLFQTMVQAHSHINGLHWIIPMLRTIGGADQQMVREAWLDSYDRAMCKVLAHCSTISEKQACVHYNAWLTLIEHRATDLPRYIKELTAEAIQRQFARHEFWLHILKESNQRNEADEGGYISEDTAWFTALVSAIHTGARQRHNKTKRARTSHDQGTQAGDEAEKHLLSDVQLARWFRSPEVFGELLGDHTSLGTYGCQALIPSGLMLQKLDEFQGQ